MTKYRQFHKSLLISITWNYFDPFHVSISHFFWMLLDWTNINFDKEYFFLKYKIQFNEGIFWYFIYSMFQNKYEMDFGFNGYVSLIRKPPSHSSNKSWLSEAILPKLWWVLVSQDYHREQQPHSKLAINFGVTSSFKLWRQGAELPWLEMEAYNLQR